MKKLIASILTLALALPMFAVDKNVTKVSNPQFHTWVSTWGATQSNPKTNIGYPPNAMPEIAKINGLNAVSLGFFGWDKKGNIFTDWVIKDKVFKNVWLTPPKPGNDGLTYEVSPWYWMWTFSKAQNPKVQYYIGAGGWSYGGGKVESIPKSPNIWTTLGKMSYAERSVLAKNLATIIKQPYPVYQNWSWWFQTGQKPIGKVYLSGINLDLETVETDGVTVGKFSQDDVNGVADLIGQLKKLDVHKIIATVMVDDFRDNHNPKLLELLNSQFDNFTEIHIMAYDKGDRVWAKEGYKKTINEFAKKLSDITGKSLQEVKHKMVIGLSACNQYTPAGEEIIIERPDQLNEKAEWIVGDSFDGTFLWCVGEIRDNQPGYNDKQIVEGIIRSMY